MSHTQVPPTGESPPGVCGYVGTGQRVRVDAMASRLGGLPVAVDHDNGAIRVDSHAVALATPAPGKAYAWSPSPLPPQVAEQSAQDAARHDALVWSADHRGGELRAGISGAAPVYADLGSHDGAVYFCSRLDPLVATRPQGSWEPDWTAWAQIIALGGPLEGRTTYQGIRRMQPQSRIEAGPAGDPVHVEDGWEWLEVLPREGATPDAVREALVDHLGGVLRNGSVASMLSGGWDARVLATLARHVMGEGSRDRLTAWTTSKDTGTVTEELVAAQVAAQLGIRHTVVGTRLDRFAHDFADLARRVEYQTSFHPWLVPLAQRLAGSGVVALDGLGGGLFVGTAFVEDEEGQGGSLVDQRFARMARYLGAGVDVLHPRALAQIRDRARSGFEEVARPLADHPYGGTMTAYLARTLPGISRAPYAVVASSTRVVTPFASDAVMRAAMAVPLDKRADDRMYRELLAPVSPGLAALHTASELSPPLRRHPRHIASPEAAGHLRELLLRGPVRELLSPRLAGADVGVWQEHLGKTRNQHLIRGLAMLSLWHEEHGGHTGSSGVDALMGRR